MKKTISSTISVVILVLVTTQLVIASVSSNSTQSNQDISLTRRDIHPQPRTPLLESGSYTVIITTSSSIYTGGLEL